MKEYKAVLNGCSKVKIVETDNEFEVSLFGEDGETVIDNFTATKSDRIGHSFEELLIKSAGAGFTLEVL